MKTSWTSKRWNLMLSFREKCKWKRAKVVANEPKLMLCLSGKRRRMSRAIPCSAIWVGCRLPTFDGWILAYQHFYFLYVIFAHIFPFKMSLYLNYVDLLLALGECCSCFWFADTHLCGTCFVSVVKLCCLQVIYSFRCSV